MDQWEDHFREVFNSQANGEQTTPITDPLTPSRPNRWDNHIEELDREITEQEVTTAINNLKSGKAAGEDQIPAEFLKLGGNVITNY